MKRGTGSEYFLHLTPGGIRLERRGVRTATAGRVGGAQGNGGTGTGGRGREGRPITGFTPKTRGRMRWVFNALPWDEVPRLTMVTLTYPGDWRSVCPDPTTLKRQLRAFRERWRRKWGGAQGAWALEFQPREERRLLRERFAPHFHLYVGLPEGACLEQDRTDGRLMWEWAREAWFGVVGSSDRAHRYWGAHVRPCFYGRYGGGRENARRVGDYLWRESGKLAQKETPYGFQGVKWWDVWGLEPREYELGLSKGEFVEMRRPLRLLRDKKTGAKVRRPVGMDGLAVTNVQGVESGVRLLRWAKDELAALG